MVEIECDNCGTVFNRKVSHIKENNYCSKECWYSSEENKNRPNRKTGKYKECPICGKEFYVQKSRLGRRKYCSKECMYKEMKTHQICPVCGKKFYNRGNSSVREYCSRKCSQEAHKNGKEVECEWCGKEVYKPKCHLEKSEHHFCSIDCLNKWQGKNKIEFKCEVCGKKIRLPKSRVESGNPRFCSIECRDKSDDWIGNSKGGLAMVEKDVSPTSLELKGKEILERLGFEKGSDFQERTTINGKFNVDILFPDEKVVIEWDGDYWHGHPSQEPLNKHQRYVQKRDYSENQYMKACGFTVLRFWGSEVRGEMSRVKEKIMEELNENWRRRIQKTSEEIPRIF